MEAIVEWFVDLYSATRANIYLLKIEYGIEPAVTIVLAALILIGLVAIVCNMAKHRKFKKAIKANEADIEGANQSIDNIYDSIDNLSKNIELFDDKLQRVENRVSKSEEAGKDQDTGRRFGPEIIYIDNRQMVGDKQPDKSDKEEIMANIDAVMTNSPDNGQSQTRVITRNDEIISADKIHTMPSPTDFDEKLSPGKLEEKGDRPTVYKDRNSGISKSGVEYTLEQLQKQIKD